MLRVEIGPQDLQEGSAQSGGHMWIHDHLSHGFTAVPDALPLTGSGVPSLQSKTSWRLPVCGKDGLFSVHD